MKIPGAAPDEQFPNKLHPGRNAAPDALLPPAGRGKHCASLKSDGDIDLLWDYIMAPKGDSGVYLINVPQVQIWDPTRPDGGKLGREKVSGGLWNNSPDAPGKDPVVRADRPAGKWNHLRILMLGARVSVWLHDQLVVDHALLENHHQRSLPVLPSDPGSGDTASVGMCELQVLDDAYETVTGKPIDPRQTHGPAYGMVAAARGYQRPTLKIAGIVCSTHWNKPLTHNDPAIPSQGLEGLKRALQEAGELGCEKLLLVPGVVNKETSYANVCERAKAAIATAIPWANEAGCKICVENAWNHLLLGPLEASRFIDEIQSPRVDWHFDVGHIVH